MTASSLSDHDSIMRSGQGCQVQDLPRGPQPLIRHSTDFKVKEANSKLPLINPVHFPVCCSILWCTVNFEGTDQVSSNWLILGIRKIRKGKIWSCPSVHPTQAALMPNRLLSILQICTMNYLVCTTVTNLSKN